MKLSQCMIVKNEEKNIRQALSWGKDIVCEQIVVDTGSTDRTVEIAEEMGAKVFHFDWINDFATAKNYAIRQAMGDWIAFLDADEYFGREDAQKLMGYLEWVESRKKRGNSEKGSVILCAIAHLDRDGKIIRVQKQARLFRNKSYIQYQGKIHEQIYDKRGKGLTMADLSEKLTIYHTGYAWTEETKAEKGERNISMLLKALEDEPDSADLHLYLAESLSLIGKHKQAFEHVCLAVKKKDNFRNRERLQDAFQLRLYETYAGKDEFKISDEEFQGMYSEAVIYDGACPDFDIAAGFRYYEEEKREACRYHLELALKKAEKKENLTYSRITEFFTEIYPRLVDCCFHLGDWQGTVKYGTIFLELDRSQSGVLMPILNQFLNVEHEPVERVEEYLKRLYDFKNRKDLYFLLKHTRLAGFFELEEALKRYLTEEERIKIYGA